MKDRRGRDGDVTIGKFLLEKWRDGRLEKVEGIFLFIIRLESGGGFDFEAGEPQNAVRQKTFDLNMARSARTASGGGGCPQSHAWPQRQVSCVLVERVIQ